MLLKNDTEFLEINVLNRSNTTNGDYWDANWLEAQIHIKTNDFEAFYRTNIRVDELQTLYEDGIKLQNHKSNKIQFATMEESLFLSCQLETTGNVVCKGKANNAGNSLDFNLRLESRQLDTMLAELTNILKKYPIIGDGK